MRAVARGIKAPAAALPRVSVSPAHLLLGAAAVLVTAAVFFGGGSRDSPLVWIGGSAIIVAAGAAVAAVFGVVGVPALGRVEAAAVGLFTALTMWEGLSVVWSTEPDRSWNYFNRTLVYLAFLVLGIAVGAVRRAPRVVAVGLAGIFAAAVVWALAGKVVPALVSDSSRVARLHAPVGYWNGLALLVDMALPLALWIAAPRERPHGMRAAGVVFVYAATLALLLTYSRGGVAVALLAAALWLLVGRPRLESAAALLLGAVPAIAVAGWAFTRAGLSHDGRPYSERVHDGAWFGLIAAAVGAAVFAAAFVVSRYEARHPVPVRRRRVLARIASAGSVGAVVIAFAALIASGVGPSGFLRKFSEPSTAATQGSAGRLVTVNSTNRWGWWRESWESFTHHPLLGTGAGTFELTHRQLRREPSYATEPHNLPLQFLSETGLVGFLLFVGSIVAGSVGVARGLRRIEVGDRAPAAALAVGAAAYLAHSIVDFDWDFVAVTAPMLVAVGVLLAAGRRPYTPLVRRPFWSAAGAVAFALVALYSLAAPWLAAKRVGDAYDAAARGDLPQAVAEARAARRLNPASIDPLLAWAAAEGAEGHVAKADRLYARAISIQPGNWRGWYERAQFEASVNDLPAALADAQRATALDSFGLPRPYAVTLSAEYQAQLQKQQQKQKQQAKKPTKP